MDVVAAAADEVACPVCTLLNRSTFLSCEACGTTLNQSSDNDVEVARRIHNQLNADADVAAWSCPLCGEDGAEPCPLDECDHLYCIECLKRWISSCDESTHEPTCPECKKVLLDSTIKFILGDEQHSVRDARLMSRMGGFVDCPTPNCDARFELETRGQRRTWCSRCKKDVSLGASDLTTILGMRPGPSRRNGARTNSEQQQQQPGSGPGSSVEAAIELDSATTDDSDDGGDDDAGDGAALARHAMDQMNVKQCPGCMQAIEKDPMSCNKFECRCGTRFCWKCGRLADSQGIYWCNCTSDSHVGWDNVRNRPAPKRRRQPRPEAPAGSAGAASAKRHKP